VVQLQPVPGIVGNVTRAFGGEPLVWLHRPQPGHAAIVIATVGWVIAFPQCEIVLWRPSDIPKDASRRPAGWGGGLGTPSPHHAPGLKRPLTFVVLYQVISQFQVFGRRI
jgi:hypothetical protein